MILGCHTSFFPSLSSIHSISITITSRYICTLPCDNRSHNRCSSSRDRRLNSARIRIAKTVQRSALRLKTCCVESKVLFLLLFFWFGHSEASEESSWFVLCCYSSRPFLSSIMKLPRAPVSHRIISRSSLLLPQPPLLLFHICFIQAPASTVCLLALCFRAPQR